MWDRSPWSRSVSNVRRRVRVRIQRAESSEHLTPPQTWPAEPESIAAASRLQPAGLVAEAPAPAAVSGVGFRSPIVVALAPLRGDQA